MDEVVTANYLRLRVVDQPGVLRDIAGILSDDAISIGAVIQKEPAEGEALVDLVILTEPAVEQRMNAAIERIEALAAVGDSVVRIRMEALRA
jgi:homoserine dehydrogenase